MSWRPWAASVGRIERTSASASSGRRSSRSAAASASSPLSPARVVRASQGQGLGSLLGRRGEEVQVIERPTELAERMEQHGALVGGLGVSGGEGQHRLVGLQGLAWRLDVLARVLLVEPTQVEVGVRVAAARAGSPRGIGPRPERRPLPRPRARPGSCRPRGFRDRGEGRPSSLGGRRPDRKTAGVLGPARADRRAAEGRTEPAPRAAGAGARSIGRHSSHVGSGLRLPAGSAALYSPEARPCLPFVPSRPCCSWRSRRPQTPRSFRPRLAAPFEEGVSALKAGRLEVAEAAFKSRPQRRWRPRLRPQQPGYRLPGAREAPAGGRRLPRSDPARPSLRRAARRVWVRAFCALGQWAEATRELELAVKLAPREPLVRLQLAKAYEQGRNWAGAVEQYRALREIAPREPEYAYGLGKAYLSLSEWCLARAARARQRRRAASASPRPQLPRSRQEGPRPARFRAGRQGGPDPARDPSGPGPDPHGRANGGRRLGEEIERELALVPESAGARALQQRLQATEPKAP